MLPFPHRNHGPVPSDCRRRVALPGALIAIVLAFAPSAARALPSFARQMNLQCIVCHTEFPILTEFGRAFKLSGYTLSTGETDYPPIAFMLQPSFTRTQTAQPGGTAPGFRDNNNWALNQASIFYSGRLLGPFASRLFGADTAAIANRIGVFLQTTYDGAAKTWSWDNAELRYANSGTVAGQSATYGLYLNNNPTLQDPWNSTPAWGFPFSGSGLAPTPAAATLVDGGLSQQVGGIGAYVMWANSLYLDMGAYRTLGAGFQRAVGIDPAGETRIDGAAAYGRVALVQSVGAGRWETGALAFSANTFPGGDASASHDRVLDLGLDSEYQISSGPHDVTAMLSWIHESASRGASQALAAATSPSDSLWNLRVTLHYLYDKTYGFSAQYFAIDGSTDPLLYPGSKRGSPRSDGTILQLSFLPLNKPGGPAFWPRSNVKFSIQYTLYDHFDGARSNFDGSGRKARDNNTLYFEAWIMF
jgi:hypothetical protein